jgi:hypothetical protein
MQAAIHLRGDLCHQCDKCHRLRNMRLEAAADRVARESMHESVLYPRPSRGCIVDACALKVALLRFATSFPTNVVDLVVRWLYPRVHTRHLLRPAQPDVIISSMRIPNEGWQPTQQLREYVQKVKENREAEAAAKDGFVLLDHQTYTLNVITKQEERDRLIRKQERKQRGSLRIKADQAKKKLRTEL